MRLFVFEAEASGVLGAKPLGEGVVRSLSLTTEFPKETRGEGKAFPSFLSFLLLNTAL